MKAFVTRRPNGQYSTILLPNGVIETIWFPDAGEAIVVHRTIIANLVADRIREFENEEES